MANCSQSIFVLGKYSKYECLTSLEVREEIFKSVQKELRDEINIALHDQVILSFN